MKRSFFKYIMVLPVFLVFIFFLGDISFAAPITGEIYKFKQPDNTYVDVRIWGDEFYQRVESIDGYTLCHDPITNWICYAGLNSSSTDFVSTGIIYRGSSKSETSNLNNMNISKGLKLNRESIIKKASKKRSELFLGPDSSVNNSLPGLSFGFNFNNPFQGMEPDFASSNTNPVIIQKPTLIPSFVKSGNVTGITILVDFTDCKSDILREEISNMINKPGYKGFGNNGSVKDYFNDVSLGKLTYTNEVLGFYTAKKPKAYYDQPGVGRSHELVLEALKYAEETGFDFSKLSASQGKMVYAVNILYAGETGLWGQGLWPHAGSIAAFYADGVFVSNYALSAIGSNLKIGPFVHESCHMVLGYPDLYDYDDDSKGVGRYCIMGATDGTNPQPPNPYLRAVISGWGSITNLNTLSDNSLVTMESNSNEVCQYTNQYYKNEFFLIESVCRKGRRVSMYDEGLVIWHIDTRANDNYFQDRTYEKHYKVSVEQADGQFHLENNIDNGSAGDLFHRGYADAFNKLTKPDSNWWSGAPSGLDISDIIDVGDIMTFIIHNTNTKTPVPVNTPTSSVVPVTPTPSAQLFTISGYITPDYYYSYFAREIGFKVEIADIGRFAYTDSNGYFEIPDVNKSLRDYTVKISKEGFLTKSIKKVVVTGNVSIGLVNLWTGDFNQDNAINMMDIVEFAKYFNSISGDEKYCEKYDVNRDYTVNMLDIMIIVKHFNKSSKDYPEYLSQ